jgi:hypothetical protein
MSSRRLVHGFEAPNGRSERRGAIGATLSVAIRGGDTIQSCGEAWRMRSAPPEKVEQAKTFASQTIASPSITRSRCREPYVAGGVDIRFGALRADRRHDDEAR